MKKKKSVINPKPNQAGVMRNDLPGYMKVRGNKISVRYKGKDIATGFPNTKIGWQLANEWWAVRSKELQAIEIGEKAAEDSIENIFKKFLDYKQKVNKITKKTLQYYITGYKAVFGEPQEILSESSIKSQIKHFIEKTTISDNSINIYLRSVAGFLAWAADDEQNYIPNKKYVAKYKRPKVVKVKPPYAEDEYNELVSYFNTSNYEMSLLLQFLWHTGSRCGEALEIKTSDIDLKNNRILIANKIFKGEQEYLLLTEQAVNIVNQLVELTKKRNDGKLFSWKETRLPNRCLERAENNLGLKIEGRGLHGFRRGFADRLFENGLEIPEVQEIMRHREINTTINHYKTTKQRMLLDKMNEKLK